MVALFMAALFTTASYYFLKFMTSLKTGSLSARITSKEYIYPQASLSHLGSILSGFKSKKFSNALFELPEILDLLSVSLSSGSSVFNSIKAVVSRAEGAIAKEFRTLLASIELGSSFENELRDLSKRLPQQHVIELCNKLSLAMKRGTPLSKLLQDLSQSVQTDIQNQISKQAGKNETRMMIPLVFLILPITILFAIFPSVQLINFQTI